MVLTDADYYTLTLLVQNEYEEITEYSSDLKRIQKEKRQYLDQIVKLLGLHKHDRTRREQSTPEGTGTKPVQFRKIENGGDETSG